MTRTCLLSMIIASMLALFADQSAAQFSFGVTPQNGVVSTGGVLRLGGSVTPGRTGVRLGVSAGASNLIGVGTFKVRNGGGNGGIANNVPQRPPSAAQFVQASRQFDRDSNGRLDHEELTQVATAVIVELQRRKALGSRSSRSRSRRTGKSKSAAPNMSHDKMVEAFVKRCMKFDADEDEALDAAETKKMATALIRSLG